MPVPLTTPATTFRGAIRLAGTIREYWASRGYRVRPRVVRDEEIEGEKPVFVVKTDLVNGRPVRRIEAASSVPYPAE